MFISSQFFQSNFVNVKQISPHMITSTLFLTVECQAEEVSQAEKDTKVSCVLENIMFGQKL